MEELNKDLRSLQKQTKETKYSSMMQLLRLALSGLQVKNRTSEPGTFSVVLCFFNSHVLSEVKAPICSSSGRKGCSESIRKAEVLKA